MASGRRDGGSSLDKFASLGAVNLLEILDLLETVASLEIVASLLCRRLGSLLRWRV